MEKKKYIFHILEPFGIATKILRRDRERINLHRERAEDLIRYKRVRAASYFIVSSSNHVFLHHHWRSHKLLVIESDCAVAGEAVDSLVNL